MLEEITLQNTSKFAILLEYGSTQTSPKLGK